MVHYLINLCIQAGNKNSFKTIEYVRINTLTSNRILDNNSATEVSGDFWQFTCNGKSDTNSLQLSKQFAGFRGAIPIQMNSLY